MERKELSESLVEGLLPSSMLPPTYHGNPIDFEFTGGQVHDAKVAGRVLSKISTAEHIIADKGYDSKTIREQVKSRGMNPIIPRKSNSKKPNPEFDAHLYKLRHLVENLIRF